MRILLTGATGFVGGHVAAALAAGNTVISPARGAGGALPPGVERVPFSENLAGLVAAHSPDAVVNLLGIISGDFDLVHVEYTRRLLAGAAAFAEQVHVQIANARLKKSPQWFAATVAEPVLNDPLEVLKKAGDWYQVKAGDLLIDGTVVIAR